mmetsp:Transcript_28903/g.52893  ORF Transcript_28903/g.52893 Transcript_28903/m.52893 type:complete len:330 (-) Transcript_28903:1280-2269(-)|eukprot:CAMPEP_0198299652 /NCGR_PEP_ID=MMETSP1449-20131203/45577_1 /TAXON_ID=420275 /ORGANISM="Attheya septentrionalis, Strain CCMP2084" /LENGTH=329 /DNA_ID=CAMNT_0044001279 /DNA_START=71 /DNA_END=1060 /DNA_ORIENTATION=+
MIMTRFSTTALVVVASFVSEAWAFSAPRQTMSSVAFLAPGGRSVAHHRQNAMETTSTSTSTTRLQMSSEPPRRRKRKDGKIPQQKTLEDTFEPDAADDFLPLPTAPLPPPVKKEEAFVEVEVKNIKDLLSGGSNVASATNSAATSQQEKVSEVKAQDDEDDDEWEFVDDDEEEDPNFIYEYEDDDEEDGAVAAALEKVMVDKNLGSEKRSMDDLLAEARSLVSGDKETAESFGLSEDEATLGGDEALSIPDLIIKGISTLVTADFFVVIGLLLWFLAGIFCSYILKDDTVQIAFNNNFEPVVQPALGVLMIGSALGAVFNKDEEDMYVD